MVNGFVCPGIYTDLFLLLVAEQTLKSNPGKLLIGI